MAASESESRFEGAGQEFHAKYMGSVDVAKSKGQEVCQEAMQKLLVALKGRKDPKPRLIINLSYEGTRLKEMPPGFNLLDMTFKHNQVSYVWKDPRDQRSLGIVRTEPDPEDASKVVHKFHGIRTVKPAMPFLQEMQELFRIVKERATQQKERAATVAASPADAPPAAENDHQNSQQQEQHQPQATSAEDRNRATSNLLGPDEEPTAGGLPKNESVASLDDLGDIFSASTTVSEPSTSQPMGGSGGSGSGSAFNSQPMGSGGGRPFSAQPMGGSPFGAQPMEGSLFGAQPMGGSPFGSQPMGGSSFGQPMGGGAGGGGAFNPQPMGGSPFGQPMGGGGNPFGAQQPMGGGGFGGGSPFGQSTVSNNPFGQQQQQPGQVRMMGPGYPAYQNPYQQPPPPPPQQQQQQQYYGQQQQPASTNPFAMGGDVGGPSLFDRQNSAPNAGAGDLLTPVSLNPSAAGAPGSSGKPAAIKPDAFSDLVVGLTSSSSVDPKRQQLTSKELFKPVDKPKTTLRDLANQSPRP